MGNQLNWTTTDYKESLGLLYTVCPIDLASNHHILVCHVMCCCIDLSSNKLGCITCILGFNGGLSDFHLEFSAFKMLWFKSL